MKRILILVLIISLAAGLLSGCAGPKTPETEPLEITSEKEATDPVKSPEDETFEVPTGLPYQGKVMESCLFHDGTLFTPAGMLKTLPKGAEAIGRIRTLSLEELPDEEFEASQLYVGMKVYLPKGGNALIAEYDDTHYLYMEPFVGEEEDLFTPSWMRERAFVPRLSSEVDPRRVFNIGVLPNMDRDLVIDHIVKELRVGILYDKVAEKAFSVYSSYIIESPDAALALMRAILAIKGVLTVEWPQNEFPGEKLSKIRYGSEMIPAGEEAGSGADWKEYETLKEAEATFGGTFEIPENDMEKVFRVIRGQEMRILEVIFLKDGKEVCRLRKGFGYGDPSGDTEHQHLVCHIDGKRGDLETFYRNDEGNERFFTAYRAYSDYSYSVTVTEPMTEEELLKLFKDDKHKCPESKDHPNSRDWSDYAPEKWKKLEPVTEGPEDPEIAPTEAVFNFPRQGENGRNYSPDTLILVLDPAYDRETVLTDLMARFGLELKYDFRTDENLVAVTTEKTLSENDFYDLASRIFGTAGVLRVERDALNELNTVPVTTLSDI
ncbi:MAG: hypothetical protein J6Y95_04425 [Lachnospiraceae bacterium]|nr:hypothetical protein [Lachnospiraceae bacterium]